MSCQVRPTAFFENMYHAETKMRTSDLAANVLRKQGITRSGQRY